MTKKIIAFGASSSKQSINKQLATFAANQFQNVSVEILDLNDYDRLKEVVVTYKNEIYELNNKVLFLQKENTAWSQNDKLNNDLIIEKNKTIEIYKSENQDLKKENKRLKTKNGLYMIISAIIITPLTYIAVTK